MSWQRAIVAPALADVLKAAQPEGGTVNIFAAPPETLNTPAVVVGRPIEVRYSVSAFAQDEAQLPVVCIGPSSGEDVVDGLIAFVRAAVGADPTLGGTVPSCAVTSERNWRPLRIGGAEMLGADVVLTVIT